MAKISHFAATAIAEVALCLWLLVMGVNVQRSKEQAEAAGERSELRQEHQHGLDA